jgi:hypothetical protein
VRNHQLLNRFIRKEAGFMTRMPDGITDAGPATGLWERHSTPISLLTLGAWLMAGLSGVLGGGPSPTLQASFSSADMSVNMPQVLRNGEFFEIQIRIEAKAPLQNATLAIAPTLWKDMTVNTILPAAERESFRGGRIQLEYGPRAAGEMIEIKIDGQVNPPLFAGTRGSLALYDGPTLLGQMPVSIAVRP